MFADVEEALKTRLRLPANRPVGVGAIINDFLAVNPYWIGPAFTACGDLADIRNVLTHQRGTDFGYPVAVTSRAIESLREIKEHLLKPEPASHRYRTPVLTVSSNHSLAAVLAMAFENGFSQFPVVTDGRFGGLITENEITRWLGRRVKANAVEVNLATVTVKTQYTSTSTAACSADFTTSSNFRSFVFGSLSFAETSGTDSRKLSRKLLFTA